MKINFLLAVCGITLLTGCTRHYVVTLNNGNQISAFGKPKRENGAYVFKDAKGQQVSIPAGRVSEVAPASMAGSHSSPGFLPVTSQ